MIAGAACGGARALPSPVPATTAHASITKHVAFALLEDYEKGTDLREVERDFALMRELGVHTWRGSFSWIDYEPERGRYDFAWLHDFARLAARDGITLRPYIGYTPEWAAMGRRADGATWNDPPAELRAWSDFVRALVGEMRRHPNVVSYEIYNEENTKLWWDGTAEEYAAAVAAGAEAVHAANPRAAILMGGMVWPDAQWAATTCGGGNARRIDVVPVHAYPETWTPDSVTVENWLGAWYVEHFLPAVDSACGVRPIWIDEAGFATTPGKTEREQANWWARAIATFMATPRVEEIGIYEIKDKRPDKAVIGEPANYFLGLTRVDRTKKLAFHTVAMLVRLLDVGTLGVEDDSMRVEVTAGRAERLYRHLFVRPDGRRVLFVWDRTGSPTLAIQLARPGTRVVEYALDGGSAAYPEFDGRTIAGVHLAPGEVRTFVIDPASSR
jgi:hypothetical protein